MLDCTSRAPNYIHTCITEFYLEQWSAEFLPYGAGRIEKVFGKAGDRGDRGISPSHWQAQSSKGLHEAWTTPDCSYVWCMACGKMYALCQYNCTWWIKKLFLLTNIKYIFFAIHRSLQKSWTPFPKRNIVNWLGHGLTPSVITSISVQLPVMEMEIWFGRNGSPGEGVAKEVKVDQTFSKF